MMNRKIIETTEQEISELEEQGELLRINKQNLIRDLKYIAERVKRDEHAKMEYVTEIESLKEKIYFLESITEKIQKELKEKIYFLESQNRKTEGEEVEDFSLQALYEPSKEQLAARNKIKEEMQAKKKKEVEEYKRLYKKKYGYK